MACFEIFTFCGKRRKQTVRLQALTCCCLQESNISNTATNYYTIHVLFQLLPNQHGEWTYALRKRPHDRLLIQRTSCLSDCNFITINSFKTATSYFSCNVILYFCYFTSTCIFTVFTCMRVCPLIFSNKRTSYVMLFCY